MVVFIECKKCPYYESKREIAAGKVLVGYCKLRNKHISDMTIRKGFCKDRATVDVPSGEKATPIKPEPSLYTEKEKAQVEKAMQKQPAGPASPTFAELAAKQGLEDISQKPSNPKTCAPIRTMMLPPKAEISQKNSHQKPSNPNPCAYSKAALPQPKSEAIKAKPAMKTPNPSDVRNQEGFPYSAAAMPSSKSDISQSSSQKPSNRATGPASHAPVKGVLLPPNEEISQNSRKPYHLRGRAQAPEVKKPAQPEKAQIVPPLKMTPEEAMKLLDQQLSGKINAKFTKYGNEAKDGEKDIIRRAVWGGGT